MKFKSPLKMSAVLGLAAMVLAACAGGPEFPKAGQPGPYDGLWAGDIVSSCETWTDVRVKGEVRYGHFIGTIYSNKNPNLGDVWGQISPSGGYDGLLGSYGISGGWAKIQFQPDDATGTWATRNCNGTLKLNKA